MRHKRRALVLGDEAARHPFLRSLPPHVRRVDRLTTEHMRGGRLQNWRDFFATYCAGFVAVTVFIA